MKLWIVYLIIAVISAILFRWFVHGIPAGIAALLCILSSLLCVVPIDVGKKDEENGFMKGFGVRSGDSRKDVRLEEVMTQDREYSSHV